MGASEENNSDNRGDVDPELAPASATPSLRVFWVGMVVLLGVALVLRIAILDEYTHKHPTAIRPWMDGLIYWQMAEQIASGKLIGDTPYQSAPLYPHVLGVIRALGGGLFAARVTQIALHLLTALLIGWVTRRRFGQAAALIATALFLSLTEPAVSCTRILADSVQVLMAVVVWWRWVVLGERACLWRDVLVVSVLIGLFALAFPAAVLLVPAFALYLLVVAGWKRGWLRAGVGSLVAIVVVSPATIHNAIVTGEFIPISANSGINLRLGNGPRAAGTIHPIPGVKINRETMFEAAAKEYKLARGRDGNWAEVDDYFRDEAVKYWRENPLGTLKLLGRKLRFFLTARNYADTMSLGLERELGMSSRVVLAPLATPWLFGGALVGLIAILRRPVRHAPEMLLTLLPVVVVLLFFYSPRYRLPSTPLLCALFAYALTLCRPLSWRSAVIVAVMLLPLPAYLYNRAVGFDGIVREHFLKELSTAQGFAGDHFAELEDVDSAEQRYASAVELWSLNDSARFKLARIYMYTGRLDDAERELREIVRVTPNHLLANTDLYDVYVLQGQYPEALKVLQEIVELAPSALGPRLALSWMLSSCPDDSVRDGRAALRAAEKARELAGDRIGVIDTLAAAYAELEDFEKATELAAAAAFDAGKLNRPKQLQEIQSRLAGYMVNRPYRAPPRTLGAGGALVDKNE